MHLRSGSLGRFGKRCIGFEAWHAGFDIPGQTARSIRSSLLDDYRHHIILSNDSQTSPSDTQKNEARIDRKQKEKALNVHQIP